MTDTKFVVIQRNMAILKLWLLFSHSPRIPIYTRGHAHEQHFSKI